MVLEEIYKLYKWIRLYSFLFCALAYMIAQAHTLLGLYKRLADYIFWAFIDLSAFMIFALGVANKYILNPK